MSLPFQVVNNPVTFNGGASKKCKHLRIILKEKSKKNWKQASEIGNAKMTPTYFIGGSLIGLLKKAW